MREEALIHRKVVHSHNFTQVLFYAATLWGYISITSLNHLPFTPSVNHDFNLSTQSAAAAVSYDAVAFHDTERREIERRRREAVEWREDAMRCWGMCVLTVRCCSNGLVYSSYRLKGGRRDVGVMETKSAHTRTMRYRDTSPAQHANHEITT